MFTPHATKYGHPPVRVQMRATPGKNIAGGLVDGKVCIYDVEEKTWDRRYIDSHTSAVRSLQWTQLRPRVSKHPLVGPFGMVATSAAATTLLLPMPPHLPPEGVPFVYPPGDDGGRGHEIRAALDFSQAPFSVLVSGDGAGRVHLTAAGSFHLGSIDVPMLVESKSPDASITHVSLTNDLTLLTVVATVDSAPSTVLVFDTTSLAANAMVLAEVRSCDAAFWVFMGVCHGLGANEIFVVARPTADPAVHACVVLALAHGARGVHNDRSLVGGHEGFE